MAEHEHRDAKNAAVVHNPSKQRFEINMDGTFIGLTFAPSTIERVGSNNN